MKLLEIHKRPSACLMGLLLFSGCGESGPPTYPVSGRIVYSDGKPLPGGIIVLDPVEGQSKSNPRGAVGVDGQFTLNTPPERKGAEVGKYRVMLQAFDPAYDDEKAPPGQSSPQLIHRRYEKYETSGLEVIVEPKENNEVTLQVHRSR